MIVFEAVQIPGAQHGAFRSVTYCVIAEGRFLSRKSSRCPGVEKKAMPTVTTVVTRTKTNTHQIVIGLACESGVPLIRTSCLE